MKFQDSSFNGLKVTVGTKSVTHARTHARTHAPKAICPINFFKVGGIISDTYCILICCYTTIATAQKRNELTLAPPWTELTLNSTGSAGNDYR